MNELNSLDFHPVIKETLKDSVTQSLRGAILDRTLAPGQHIPESGIAQRLGVSRAPVREAMATLMQEGLLQRGGRGVVVTQLTRDDVDEISSLRSALELLALELTIANGTDADFDRMEECIQRGAVAKGAGKAGELDVEFHELLISAAGHQRLLNNWLQLRSQIRLLLMQMDFDDAEFARDSAEAHGKLLALIRKRDVEAARDMHRQHLQNTHDMVVKHFDNSVDSDSGDHD